MSKNIEAFTKILAYRSTVALSLLRQKQFKQILVSSFPRSGSTFISDFLSKYFDLPCPRKYYHPFFMDSVIHSHIGYVKSLRPRIYIYRNPINCLLSYFIKTKRYSQSSFANDFDDFVKFSFRRPYGSRLDWPSHVESWIRVDNKKDKNFFIFKYESILNDPEKELKVMVEKILPFFGINFLDQKRLDLCIQLTSKKSMQRSPNAQTTFNKFNQNTLKTNIQQSTKDFLIEKCGKQMDLLGYNIDY